jgi:hypothetical protein
MSRSISLSHEGQKYAIFAVLSALVKDARQFKKREKCHLKVVTVNLPLYKQLQY